MKPYETRSSDAVLWEAFETREEVSPEDFDDRHQLEKNIVTNFLNRGKGFIYHPQFKTNGIKKAVTKKGEKLVLAAIN